MLPADLVSAALEPGEAGQRAMRLLELQALQQMGNSRRSDASGGRVDFDDLLGDLGNATEGGSSSSGSISMPRGAAGLDRVHRAIARDPEAWVAWFDNELKKELFADVSGAPHSLFDYVVHRMRFGQDLNGFCILSVV